MRVLALTVSAGKGHNKAAESVKNYFNKNFNDVEMEIVDVLKYINPVIDKIVVGSYLKSLKRTPVIYAKLYEFAESEDAISSFSGLVNDVLSLKLKTLVSEYNPDVILCTHPFPIEMLSILKKKGKISKPVAAILTDYAPHSFWLYSHVEAYIIPHEDFIHDIVEKGIPEDTVYPYGIPVSEEFLKKIDRDRAREELGIDRDKLTLLLMGGGLGIGNIKSIFEELVYSNMDVQIIAVTGSNLKLKNRLKDIASRSSKTNLIYDYTDNVSTLMSASDLLITKPGGLTITEALVKSIPIIITSPIPGQEEKNSNYLLNNGIAARIKGSDSIVSIIKQLVNSPTRLNNMRTAAMEKAKPNATRDICNLLIKLGNNSAEK